jgi:hypothetical protein
MNQGAVTVIDHRSLSPPNISEVNLMKVTSEDAQTAFLSPAGNAQVNSQRSQESINGHTLP